MDLVQIKELMTAMKKAGMKRLSIKEKTGFEIELEREDEKSPLSSQMQNPFYQTNIPPSFREYHPPLSGYEPSAPQASVAAPAKEMPAAKDNSKYITSPMVGTFYSAPSPDDPSFVKVGDRVDENTVVCIIEAMKVMNEVKAGTAGVIAEVLTGSGHPVEFGAKLFKIV